MQTRLGSLCESFSNVFVGWLVGLVSQILVFPLFNIHVPFTKNLGLSLVFTVISIIRSYTLRRWFNRRIVKRYEALKNVGGTSEFSTDRSS